jgi:hypothetical protein
MPAQNHWWHVPLYVTTRGLGTHSIPYNNQRFEIDFDFIDHQLRVTTSRGRQQAFSLRDGLSVADFYNTLRSILNDSGIVTHILARPYKLPFNTPFVEDRQHARYHAHSVERFWNVLSWTDRVFRAFNSTFYGKVNPVHFFWHSFDLVFTRFSGKTAPEIPQAGLVDREAYSHEMVSFGFWPGDETIPDAAFYSYAFPVPQDIDTTPLKPEQARWIELRESPLALLMYEDVRQAYDPRQTLLDFLDSAYRAGVEKAEWDTHSLHKKETALSNHKTS